MGCPFPTKLKSAESCRMLPSLQELGPQFRMSEAVNRHQRCPTLQSKLHNACTPNPTWGTATQVKMTGQGFIYPHQDSSSIGAANMIWVSWRHLRRHDTLIRGCSKCGLWMALAWLSWVETKTARPGSDCSCLSFEVTRQVKRDILRSPDSMRRPFLFRR